MLLYARMHSVPNRRPEHLFHLSWASQVWPRVLHVATTSCWKLISSCMTTWGWILWHPILLLFFSCVLSHISLPSTAFSPYVFIVRSLSCEYYAPHWNLWCWDKASDPGLPPKNPPLPLRAVMQRLGACHVEIADVASDSIHHAKPFLDFNFSVFSLSWSWRK